MLRSAVFACTFWPGFALHLIIAYPFAFSQGSDFAMKFVYRPMARWLVFCLKYFAKIDYEVKNLELLNDMLQKTNVIIGCNHQSTWETVVFPLILDNYSTVVKKELFNIPIAGIYFKKLLCIPVDRSSPVSAIRTLMKFGKQSVENGRNILIFPNGTRDSADSGTEYKSGIFALYKLLNIPVIPVYVNSGKYWARRSFRKKPGMITLSFREPILPGMNKEEFFAKFEERLGSGSVLPETYH
jgi:1-acyl-sn-glycerol-3-phosphate acyltransferase